MEASYIDYLTATRIHNAILDAITRHLCPHIPQRRQQLSHDANRHVDRERDAAYAILVGQPVENARCLEGEPPMLDRGPAQRDIQGCTSVSACNLTKTSRLTA